MGILPSADALTRPTGVGEGSRLLDGSQIQCALGGLPGIHRMNLLPPKFGGGIYRTEMRWLSRQHSAKLSFARVRSKRRLNPPEPAVASERQTMSKPAFHLEEVHQHFSTHCFNGAWDLIDKPVRTSDENEQMIQLAHASLWHWSQRADCCEKNLSIGYWQLARIYALLGEENNAGKFARSVWRKLP